MSFLNSRIFTLLLVLSLSPAQGYSQKVKEWLDENWQVTTDEQKAVYYRIVNKTSDGVKNGLVISYYAPDKPRMVGNFRDNELFGPFTFYYRNGQVEYKGNYLKSKRIGFWEEWYSDGKPRQTGTFLQLEPPAKPRYQNTYQITSFWDSTGIEHIKEGTGKWFEISKTGRLLTEGAYKDGVKEGKWLDYNEETGQVEHEEIFRAGELVQGTYVNEQGVQSTYDADSYEIMPEYPGGLAGLSKFLSRNMRYPQRARNRGVQGTVFVGFVVDATGQVKDMKVLKGIGYGCDEEALRVVSIMPPWQAGRQRGKAVSVHYSLPIRFIMM